MKAIQMKDYGSAKDVIVENDIELRDIKSTEVLVESYVTTIEPYDVKFRQGLFGTEEKTPITLGSTVAGIIKQIGNDVNDFKVGDRVVANIHFNGFAEFAIVESKLLAKVPDDMKFETAVSVALSGQVAYQVITKDLLVQPSDKVLVDGSNGAVGLLAVQIAKNIGADVAGLVKSLNEENESSKFVEVKDSLDGITANKIFDTVGGSLLEEIAKKFNGEKIVSIVSMGETDGVEGTYLKSNGQQLQELINLIDTQNFVVPIAKEYEFDLNNVINAIEDFEQKKYQQGKLVIKIK